MTRAEAACLICDQMAEPATGTPSEWVVGQLRFAEPGNHGPFDLAGREYWREVLDDFGRWEVHDMVLVAGSQTGKTSCLMAGAAWCIEHSPGGVLWVMPSIVLARRFSRQRFAKMLRASPSTARLVPRGAERHSFSSLEMILGGSVFNFVGSNSPANLASQPCRRVMMDETDKFDEGSRREADAITLAEQRTKGQPMPQRWKTSTPTTTDGLIWREYVKGTQHRYHVPCPKCRVGLVLGWSKSYTVLELTGHEAWVRWDKAAKRPDGSWDLERVEATTWVECPFCGRRIVDAEKRAMVAAGRWVASNPQAPASYVSRHLSSLYACAPETAWGRLAAKFLTVKDSLAGVQGFVNGDLGEPYAGQDMGGEVTWVTPARDVADWCRVMSVDVQAKHPFFWWVVRAWDGKGNSRGVAEGSAETFEEIAVIQERHQVPATQVFIDSRWGARSEAEVYSSCAEHSVLVEKTTEGPLLLGWTPMRGSESRRRWRAPNGAVMPYGFTYPGGPDPRVKLRLLWFDAQEFKTLLHRLSQGKTALEWSVPDAMASEEYKRHMQGQVQRSMPVGRSGRFRIIWDLRARNWPDHLHSCETMQLAAAASLGLLPLEGSEGQGARAKTLA
jgi:hypothetical protein